MLLLRWIEGVVWCGLGLPNIPSHLHSEFYPPVPVPVERAVFILSIHSMQRFALRSLPGRASEASLSVASVYMRVTNQLRRSYTK